MVGCGDRCGVGSGEIFFEIEKAIDRDDSIEMSLYAAANPPDLFTFILKVDPCGFEAAQDVALVEVSFVASEHRCCIGLGLSLFHLEEELTRAHPETGHTEVAAVSVPLDAGGVE